MFKVVEKPKKYEITPLTLAITAVKQKDGSYVTEILELQVKYRTSITPTKLIELACGYFGSSLKGRIDGTPQVSQMTYKVPIVIEPSSNMYFFPTASPRNKSCSWISHSHIRTVNPLNDSKSCEIEFINGQKLILDVSYGQILNQMQRTAQFRYALETRTKRMIDKMVKKDNMIVSEDKEEFK